MPLPPRFSLAQNSRWLCNGILFCLFRPGQCSLRCRLSMDFQRQSSFFFSFSDTACSRFSPSSTKPPGTVHLPLLGCFPVFYENNLCLHGLLLHLFLRLAGQGITVSSWKLPFKVFTIRIFKASTGLSLRRRPLVHAKMTLIPTPNAKGQPALWSQQRVTVNRLLRKFRG